MKVASLSPHETMWSVHGSSTNWYVFVKNGAGTALLLLALVHGEVGLLSMAMSICPEGYLLTTERILVIYC
jgi:hypothetical protein